jgi:hypothetical protein
MSTIFATENFRFSNLVKHEYAVSVAFCREVLTINDTAGALLIGSVLGKVTATGKYKISKETATDGSELPVAVLIEDVTILADTDKGILAFARGPAIVSKFGLVLDASWAGLEAQVYTALAAQSILSNDAV